MSEAKDKKPEPDISPEVRSWVENVIVPALVDEHLKETDGGRKPLGHSPTNQNGGKRKWPFSPFTRTKRFKVLPDMRNRSR